LLLFRLAPDPEIASVNFIQKWATIINKFNLNFFKKITGQKYAVYEEKAILIALLRKFRFSIDKRHLPVKETHGIIMKPAGGMPLLITLR
jgi:hypothetical protein